MPAGNWVLMEGVDETITKTATITQLSGCEDVSLDYPLINNCMVYTLHVQINTIMNFSVIRTYMY